VLKKNEPADAGAAGTNMNVKTAKKHVIRRMTLSSSARTNRQALWVFTGRVQFDVPWRGLRRPEERGAEPTRAVAPDSASRH
jgi:hypothetical protein